MAVVEMCKMRIIGLKDENPQIMEALTKSRCFEIKEANFPIPATDNSQSYSQILAKQSRIAYSIEYLEKQNNKLRDIQKSDLDKYAVKAAKNSSVRAAMGADEFFAIRNKEDELTAVMQRIDAISFRQNDIKQEINKVKESIAAYRPYIGCPLPFSAFVKTKKTVAMLFSASAGAKFVPSDLPACFEIYPAEKHIALAVVTLLENKEDAAKYLNECGFVQCPFDQDITAGRAIAELQDLRSRLLEESENLFAESLQFLAGLQQLKTLYDYYSVMLERYSLKGPASTNYIAVLEGWCPLSAADGIKSEIAKSTSCVYIDVLPPADDETVPTMLSNNAVIQPFEDLTEMYTVPDYREKDPNRFMAFWYFFIFGLMCGDVVYGLLITIACVTLLKIKKWERGMTNMLKMFGICGISSVLWGTVFGSFLGLSIPVSQNFFLSFKSVDSPTGYYLGWFNPMEKPIMLFGLGIVVGILHLIFGYGLKAVGSIQARKPFDALCDAGFPIIILVSIFFLGANIFAGLFTVGELSLSTKYLNQSLSATLNQIGLILILAGIAGLALTTGRASLKKGKLPARIGGWLGGGLNGVYGLINLISDILSYSRIFGLGLAGAAITYAFNTLVQLTFFNGMIVMKIVGVLLLAVLHLFNLGIGVLGTYVHNARLQFLEFYGKFLTGDGKSFRPLGEKTRYVSF